LSRDIEDTLSALTDAQVASANAVYSDRRYFLFLPGAPSGSRCFVWDFDEQTWSPGYNTPVYRAMPHGDDPSVSQIYALTISGGTYVDVMKLATGQADESANVTWKAQSGFYSFPEFDPDPRAQKRVRRYRVWHEGTAADTLTVKFYVNRETTATATYTDTIPAVSGGASVRSVTRNPASTIVGENISVEVGGAHDTATAVYGVDLWLQRTR